MVKVEMATQNDIAELSALLSVLFSQEDDFEPDLDRQHIGIHAIIQNGEVGQILVLRKDNQIIGMVNLLFTISTAMGGRVALLEDMVLHHDHRGVGYGSMLLKEAVRFARQSGCKRITLLTDLTNQAAVSFYMRHGFVQSAMTPLRLTI